MSANKDRTISKRVLNPNELNLTKLAFDLDSDHEYKLTKTTTETYKLTKSASKSKGKEVQAVGNSHRHSSPPQPSSSKTTPRKIPSPPRDTKELFARLIRQFDDRATQSRSAAGYTAWRALVGKVEYMRKKESYIQDLKDRQPSQLLVELEGVLHEAEYGSDVGRDFQSLRAGASNGSSQEMLREIRGQFRRSWAETVRKWQRRVQEEADRSWNQEQEKLKAQEKLQEREKQKQEEKAQAKKVRFLGVFS